MCKHQIRRTMFKDIESRWVEECSICTAIIRNNRVDERRTREYTYLRNGDPIHVVDLSPQGHATFWPEVSR